MALNPGLIYSYDGREWESTNPGAYDAFRHGEALYVLRDDGHVATTQDGKRWKKVTTKPIPVEELDLAGGAKPLRHGSVALYRGRLVAGTCVEGRIFVSPCRSRGHAVLPAAAVTLTRNHRVRVDAARPESTVLRVKVRSGPTDAALASAAWQEVADGDALGLEGALRIQFRVELESDGERRRTPVVRSLKIE